jgi:hypothetical protein
MHKPLIALIKSYEKYSNVNIIMNKKISLIIYLYQCIYVPSYILKIDLVNNARNMFQSFYRKKIYFAHGNY